ncbi:MAG: TetR/AcrR family transcriptional regulator [Mycobacterium sp.]
MRDAPVRRRRGPGSRADENHPTRLELLDAAVRLAERDGLRGLSIAEITTAAGHAKGTFYVHFADRAALLVALQQRYHDTVFAQVISQTADDPAGPDRLRRRLIAFLDACTALPAVRALLLEARTEPAIADEVDHRNQQATLVLAADLTGVVEHPRETARILVLAAADIAARESTGQRRLPAARRSLLELVPQTSADGCC